MAKRTGLVTERTFYDALLDIIREKGGSGVQEIRFNSSPDIRFDFLELEWLLSVKLGETLAVIKDAFIQYWRHKEESGIANGLLLILPDRLRSVRPAEDAVRRALLETPVSVLIDAGAFKEELRDRTFPEVLDFVRSELGPLLKRGVSRHYPLPLVMSLLKAQVSDLMRGLSMKEEAILRIVTDKQLLSDLGRLSHHESDNVARFLAAYISLSQILFLRLFAAVHAGVIERGTRPTRASLKRAFAKILDINYRPIYELDVLDLIPQDYLRDTFDLIWGLEVEKIRYELPGRIFHELMPERIRKLLAAFYTRPQAAELLARLAIGSSTDTVFDPACGSGTILVAAYRQKERLHRLERKPGNPHQRFCEQDIFGCDIMPFAVHLTTANLAAMDVAETIERTQIIQGDSIELAVGEVYKGSVQVSLFPKPRKARTVAGEEYEVALDQVDAVLMNPPFTKVERRIRDYVDMNRFKAVAGGEVGLWGHFVFLANEFLKEGGVCGAVLPVNVLRGRESAKTRKFLFTQWTPLFILKPVFNYGFSEWAEYRDILLVAKKEKPHAEHKVKFALVKADLTKLDDASVEEISESVKRMDSLRSEKLDIDSHPVGAVMERFMNMMWFCGVSDLAHRDVFVRLHGAVQSRLGRLPHGCFREGYRPVPEGVSDVLFLTRASHPSRTEQAFLRFTREDARVVPAASPMGTLYRVEKDHLIPSLRTPVGLRTMDITGSLDYIAHEPYEELRRVRAACGFRGRLPSDFWERLRAELEAVRTCVVTACRINPYSPNTHLVAYVSVEPFSASNQLNIVVEPALARAKALAVLLNSWVFFCQFFLLKEESTGRFIHIRFYDLYEMDLQPETDVVGRLARLFDKYSTVEFPALREQFDRNFDARYEEYRESLKGREQQRLWPILAKPIEPAPVRLRLDLDVARALEVDVNAEDLRELYSVIVREMMITRALTRD
jgi:tRNA1(Val) A37 N6-methylase TrmN6